MKDSSLKINSLLLNSSFSHKNVLQNDLNALSKLVIQDPVLCQKTKTKKLNILYILYGETLDLQCQRLQVATVTPKRFNGKFAVIFDYPIEHFML